MKTRTRFLPVPEVLPALPTADLARLYGPEFWSDGLPAKARTEQLERIGWTVVGPTGMPLAMGRDGLPQLYSEELAKSRASTRPGAKAARVLVKE